MNGGQHQPVGGQQPQYHYQNQYHSQQSDLSGTNGENIADQILVELGKAAAVQCSNKDAQCHSGGGKHTDNGLCRMAGLALYIGEQQCDDHGQCHGPHHGQGRTAQHTDGDPGEAGMTQCIGEKAHLTGDNHGGQESKQGCQQQNRQKGVFHKIHGQPRQRQQIAKTVPDTHALPPPIWNAS